MRQNANSPKKIKNVQILRNTVFTLALVFVLCGLVFLSACGSSNSDSSDSGKTTVSDLMGRERSIKVPAQRICCVDPASFDDLVELGAANQIIARGSACDVNIGGDSEQLSKIPDVGTGESLNIEYIVQLQPDVAILPKTGQTLGQVNALEEAGIPVLDNSAQTLDEACQHILIMGKVSGKDSQAEQIVNEMKQNFEKVKNMCKDNPKFAGKTIYFEMSHGSHGLWVAGKNTFLNEMAETMSMSNAFNDMDDWAQTTQEQVIKRNPDYIIVLSENAENNPDQKSKDVQEVLERPGWQHVAAVENNHVFAVDANKAMRPGVNLDDALQDISNQIQNSN